MKEYVSIFLGLYKTPFYICLVERTAPNQSIESAQNCRIPSNRAARHGYGREPLQSVQDPFSGTYYSF
jgi:hypothetical protein